MTTEQSSTSASPLLEKDGQERSYSSNHSQVGLEYEVAMSMTATQPHDAEVSVEGERRQLNESLAFEKASMTWTLFFCVFVAMIGGSFLFGYHSGVINCPQGPIMASLKSKGINISDFQWSVFVSIFCIGGLFGGLSGGHLANKFGRKKLMIFNTANLFIGTYCCVACINVIVFILGRLFLGLGCGIITMCVPMYLSEISPIRYRGAIGTLNQFGIVIGFVVSQVLGMPTFLGTEDLWVWLFIIPLGACVLTIVSFPLLPSSPVYLALKERHVQAEAALMALRGSQVVVRSEMEIISSEMRDEKNQRHGEDETPRITGMKAVFESPLLTRVMIIGVGIHCAQQLSGINAILYYSTPIFESAGIPNPELATVAIGTANVIATAVAVWLMDKAGRRVLLLLGFGLMTIVYCLLGLAMVYQDSSPWLRYMSVVACVFTMCSFAIGPGPIPWMITSEILPSNVRDAGVSGAVTMNWTCNFLIGLGFPFMRTLFGNGAFFPFAVLSGLFVVFTYYMVPETKGLSTDQVLEQMRAQKSNSRSAGYKPLEEGEVV
eukprot:Nk52_evm38s226 gene=Nk52_evmTU38s226